MIANQEVPYYEVKGFHTIPHRRVDSGLLLITFYKATFEFGIESARTSPWRSGTISSSRPQIISVEEVMLPKRFVSSESLGLRGERSTNTSRPFHWLPNSSLLRALFGVLPKSPATRKVSILVKTAA